MYTIKQAAARTGLSVPVIRIWERRYGVVRPERTPAGYRIYDETSISRLAAMRHLVANKGWRPRQAAQRVLEPGVDLQALGGLSDGEPQRGSAAPAGEGRAGSTAEPGSGVVLGTQGATLVAAFVSAARGLDVPAMERILDEGFAAQRFELAIESLVAPAMRAIGSAWAQGDIDVGAEHAASETVRRRLARFFDAAGPSGRVPTVIVGLPPDGHHEIGAFAFAVAGRRAGLDVLYLGANVPLESWLRTARETRAPVVVLGVVTPADLAAAAEVVRALRRSRRPPTCLVGGPFAPDSPDSPGTVRLPTALDDAVATVAEMLGRTAPGSGRAGPGAASR